MQNDITELRNQVRTLKRIVYGFGGLLVAGVVMSATSLQTAPEDLTVKSLKVVNGAGKVVVQLIATEDGGALGISNKDGTHLAAIYTTEDGGVLDIYNKDGKPAVFIYAGVDGGVLDIHSKDGTPVARLCADKDGNGVVRTMDSKGQSTSATPFPSTSTQDETSEPTIDTKDILADFEANALAAESKYKKLGAFFVTGKFKRFAKENKPDTMEFKEVILLGSSSSSRPTMRSVAILQEGFDRSVLEKFSKDSVVRFKVRFSFIGGMGRNPVFEAVQ